jgi:antitoxin ParD1/3/4
MHSGYKVMGLQMYTKIWYTEEMKKNISFYLGERYNQFISSQIESGLYDSASEVVRESLRHFQVYQHRLELLRYEVEKGEKSGMAVGFTFAKFRKEMKSKYKNHL